MVPQDHCQRTCGALALSPQFGAFDDLFLMTDNYALGQMNVEIQ
jgi:hypothetical protein